MSLTTCMSQVVISEMFNLNVLTDFEVFVNLNKAGKALINRDANKGILSAL